MRWGSVFCEVGHFNRFPFPCHCRAAIGTGHRGDRDALERPHRRDGGAATPRLRVVNPRRNEDNREVELTLYIKPHPLCVQSTLVSSPF